MLLEIVKVTCEASRKLNRDKWKFPKKTNFIFSKFWIFINEKMNK